jgi:FAD/FMN-containing dehydrogenase
MLSAPQSAPDLEGLVLTPGDPAYDDARTVFAAHVDRRPALIARVADPDDIARVIDYARETGSELAVRGGGHSPAGHGVTDGGVVIDLSALRTFELDPAGRTAWAGAGLTAGAYTVAAGRHRLATGFGDTGSVGIGGITLAGGIGFLVRKHGLTIDHLLAAEIVTADGRLRRVDAETEPDLFWALRGGGGNFGVVTRLKYRLHPVDTVVGGPLVLPATPEVIAGFVAEAEAAPDELSAIANVMLAPPLPFLPEKRHGSPVVMAQMVFAGDLDAGRRALAPFRALAEPVADLVRPMKYPAMYPDEDPRPRAAVGRTTFADGIGSRQAQAILERIPESSATMAACEMRVLGGAMARVPADATAFAHRQSRMMVNVAAIYDPATSERAEHAAWVDRLSAELHDGDPGAYAGFLADEGEERVRAAYPGATWQRLAAVKARYDPDNLFRLNQNVPPAACSSETGSRHAVECDLHSGGHQRRERERAGDAGVPEERRDEDAEDHEAGHSVQHAA